MAALASAAAVAPVAAASSTSRSFVRQVEISSKLSETWPLHFAGLRI